MKPYIKTAWLVAAILAGMGFSAAASFAHHLWVEETDGAYAVCRGMMGERLDPYDPARVSRIQAFDAEGREISVNRRDEKERAAFTVDGEAALAVVECAWGHRVNTTQGKKLMDRKAAEAQGLRVLSAFSSTQYAKIIFAPGPAATKSLGLKLEIVPEKDPLASDAGNTLPVRLLFDGKPLAGIEILTRNDMKIQTDLNGRAVLPVDGKRSFLFYARHKLPAEPGGDLDELVFTTFLVFEVK